MQTGEMGLVENQTMHVMDSKENVYVCLCKT